MGRVVQQIFSELPSSEDLHYQYVQLYDKQFTDLLDPNSKKLSIVDGSKFTYVQGAQIVKATSAASMLKEVEKGASFRASGKTNMNDASSRSHAILLLMIAENKPDSKPEDGRVMYMVDLAGSERVKRSGASGQLFNEAV